MHATIFVIAGPHVLRISDGAAMIDHLRGKGVKRFTMERMKTCPHCRESFGSTQEFCSAECCRAYRQQRKEAAKVNQ